MYEWSSTQLVIHNCSMSSLSGVTASNMHDALVRICTRYTIHFHKFTVEELQYKKVVNTFDEFDHPVTLLCSYRVNQSLTDTGIQLFFQQQHRKHIERVTYIIIEQVVNMILESTLSLFCSLSFRYFRDVILSVTTSIIMGDLVGSSGEQWRVAPLARLAASLFNG